MLPAPFLTFCDTPYADRERHHFEHLPEPLTAENVFPHIPRRYRFQADFRFLYLPMSNQQP